MGYDTEYEGVLYFADDGVNMTVEELRYLKSILGEDFRDHPKWKELLPINTSLTYIDLELTDDFTGFKWTGGEKSHDMIDAVNLIKNLMEDKFGETFYLKGKFICQGEDIEDRWFLMIGDDGYAYREDINIGSVITCPHCGERFELGS